tara:strand:- start:32 stop:487 length:456 start_codon:yes stop_codon:yes gene_type:complete
MVYYTKTGEKIRNPEAYAQTGAPMYKNKYYDNNINKTHYIYKLNLEDNKKYIGMTCDLDRRLNQHCNGQGSKVTKKFHPNSYKVLEECPGYFAKSEEQYYTEKYIDKYGYKNVRGGNFCNSKTLKRSNYIHEESSDSCLSSSDSDDDGYSS